MAPPQVLDAPGDERFAPLGTLFYSSTPYALLVFDATSIESFEALEPIRDAFVAAHAGASRTRPALGVVANVARMGVGRAVSTGYALEWCMRSGDLPYFEVDADEPQGILPPIRHLVDEILTSKVSSKVAVDAEVPLPVETAAPPARGGERGGVTWEEQPRRRGSSPAAAARRSARRSDGGAPADAGGGAPKGSLDSRLRRARAARGATSGSEPGPQDATPPWG